MHSSGEKNNRFCSSKMTSKLQMRSKLLLVREDCHIFKMLLAVSSCVLKGSEGP